jgi:hypothetical protein
VSVSPRLLVGVVLAVLLAGGAWFFTRSTDEARINRLLDDLTRAGDVEADSNIVARTLRVKSAFGSAFQSTARVDVPELGSESLDSLQEGVIGAGALLHDGTVRLDARSIVLDDAHLLAKVNATAHLDGHRHGEPLSATRPAELQLRKIDGAWKIVTAHVGVL